MEEALYYLQQTANCNWKRTVLIYHIESGYFHRQGKAQNNFKLTLPKSQSELAHEILKNPYNIGFLNLTEEVSEKKLENAILSNLKKFLLELGTGFSFYGQQFHIKVGDKDFYIDLIFYHTRLRCYFVIELKITDFEPEHAGKLEFYITATDEQIKLPDDNPTIGLLLCKTADKVVVEYSLKTKTKPMGVAEYKHAIPKKWKDELPDEKTLKLELEKEIVIPKNPVDEKINKLKQIVQKMNANPTDPEKDNNLVKKAFWEIQSPLIKLIDKKIEDVKPLFKKYKIEGIYNQQVSEWDMLDFNANAMLLRKGNIQLLAFEFILETFIQAGTKAFNARHRLEIHLDKNKYIIGPDRGKVWQEKIHRKFPSKDELEEIANRFVETMLDDISDKAKKTLHQ